MGRRRSDRNSIGCLRKKKMGGLLLALRVGRVRETGRRCEGARTFNRLDEALEYWIDMIWCNYSLFLSSFNTLFLFFPLPLADWRPASSHLCIASMYPSIYCSGGSSTLSDKHDQQGKDRETLCREKRWNWIEFSCRPGVLYITAFLSNNNITHTHKKKGKKKENRQRKEIDWLLRNRIYDLNKIKYGEIELEPLYIIINMEGKKKVYFFFRQSDSYLLLDSAGNNWFGKAKGE